MYLLIDQSRKGSVPPTPRPPLPSVNQSRNNLMIGAPCPFLVPSAARSRRGLLWRRASGNLSLLLTPGFSLLRSGFQRNGFWATKKAKGAPDVERGRKGLFRNRQSTCDRLARQSTCTRESRLGDRTARWTRKESHFSLASFHSNAASTYSQIFCARIHERDKSRTTEKRSSSFARRIQRTLFLSIILRILRRRLSRGFEPKLSRNVCVNQLDLHYETMPGEVWRLNQVIINWKVREDLTRTNNFQMNLLNFRIFASYIFYYIYIRDIW